MTKFCMRSACGLLGLHLRTSPPNGLSLVLQDGVEVWRDLWALRLGLERGCYFSGDGTYDDHASFVKLAIKGIACV